MFSLNHSKTFKDSHQKSYEVWYFKLNTADLNFAFWGRLTLLQNDNGERYFEKWAIFSEKSNDQVFHTAVKESLPFDSFQELPESIGNSFGYWGKNKTEAQLKGKYKINWSFNHQGNNESFDPVPKTFKLLHLAKSQVITPDTRINFNGFVDINGKNYNLNHALGSQGHIWGSKQAQQWVWAHSCVGKTESNKDFVFELLSAQVLLAGCVKSPWLTSVYLKLGNETWVWNQALELIRNKVNVDFEAFTFKTCIKNNLFLVGTFQTPIHYFAGVKYADTDGSNLYCHNSKFSHLTLKVFKDNQCIDQIFSEGSAFEFVTRSPHHKVKFII